MNSMYNKIIDILSNNSISVEVISHEAAYNSEEVLSKINTDPLAESKSLALKVKDEIYVFTIPLNDKIDKSLIQKVTSINRFSFIARDEVQTALGVEPGAVSPFGYGSNIKCYISSKFLRNDFFYFSPAVHHLTFKIQTTDLQKLFNLKVLFLFD